MRKVAFLALWLSALCWAQSNTPEYNLNVHVTSSEWLLIPSAIGPQPTQELSAVIDGKKYELQAYVKKRAVLSPGDYKAKLVEDVHKNSYESTQTYELQFPDKTTRKYDVIGQNE
jgi:hypothetical protein